MDLAGFFKFEKALPDFVRLGAVRDDVAEQRVAEVPGLSVLTSGAEPAEGQLVILEIQLDEARCTWDRADDTTSWVIAKGTVLRVVDREVFLAAGLEVTTTPVPRELSGSFAALVQRADDGRWDVAQIRL